VARPPVTPDGRYFVVRGGLWRCSRPDLTPERRQTLVDELMAARRAARAALAAEDAAAWPRRRQGRDRQGALGEREPVWWSDAAPDLNRHMARNTPYAAWLADLS
jgi:hypothetical protein